MLSDYLDDLRDGWDSMQRWAGFWGPTVSLPSPLQPVATLGTLIALLAITGVALGSLALFITSTLVLYLILSQLFGLEIELALPRA